MRMHRGSSKDDRSLLRASETLPLSAPPSTVHVTFEFVRGGRSSTSTLELATGTPVREGLAQLGQPAEGCAVLNGETPWPLDAPIEHDVTLTVVSTFSGG